MGFFLGYLALYIDFFLSLQVQFKRLIIMQILLANAKIMFEKADRKPISVPLFQSVANDLAKEMALMNVEELAKQLDCSSKIAMTNWKRYHDYLLPLWIASTVGWHRTLSYGALRIARSYKRQAYQSVLERQTDRCSHR